MKAEEWFGALNSIIHRLEVTESGNHPLEMDAGFGRLLEKTSCLRESRSHFFFIGNGASASMASHIAADLNKNAKLKTRVFTDLALLTALVNDLGVEHMFAEPLSQQASKGDMLVVISSSGNSRNLVHAVEHARELGLYVVTFTGMEPGNQLRKLGDLNFYIPAPDYGLAESGHAALLHFWVDAFLEEPEPLLEPCLVAE